MISSEPSPKLRKTEACLPSRPQTNDSSPSGKQIVKSRSTNELFGVVAVEEAPPAPEAADSVPDETRSRGQVMVALLK
jgi:hypothetical protein